MPNKICLIVIAGFQPLSSSRMERQTVPEGKTLGWKSGGVNLHLGGLEGYSSGKIMRSLYSPPSHGVCSGRSGACDKEVDGEGECVSENLKRGLEESGKGQMLAFALPGMPTSQFMRSSEPSDALAGRA